MKSKYCFECKGDKGPSKLHYWVETDDGCECKRCGLTAPMEDADEIFDRHRK